MALRLLAAAHLRHVCFGVFSGEKRGVVSCHVTATVASKEPPRRPVVTVKWFTVLYVRPAVLARCQYNVDLRSEDHGLKSVWIGDPGDTKQLIQSGRLGGGSDHQGAAGELGSASSGSLDAVIYFTAHLCKGIIHENYKLFVNPLFKTNQFCTYL